MKTHKQLKMELMKDLEFKKAYDELEFEFKIIDSLIRARTLKKFSQRELAGKIGITQSSLARFESGRTNPTLSFLRKITNGLGLKLVVQ